MCPAVSTGKLLAVSAKYGTGSGLWWRPVRQTDKTSTQLQSPPNRCGWSLPFRSLLHTQIWRKGAGDTEPGKQLRRWRKTGEPRKQWSRAILLPQAHQKFFWKRFPMDTTWERRGHDARRWEAGVRVLETTTWLLRNLLQRHPRKKPLKKGCCRDFRKRWWTPAAHSFLLPTPPPLEMARPRLSQCLTQNQVQSPGAASKPKSKPKAKQKSKAKAKSGNKRPREDNGAEDQDQEEGVGARGRKRRRKCLGRVGGLSQPYFGCKASVSAVKQLFRLCSIIGCVLVFRKMSALAASAKFCWVHLDARQGKIRMGGMGVWPASSA